MRIRDIVAITAFLLMECAVLYGLFYFMIGVLTK